MQSHLHTTLKLWRRRIGLRTFVTDYLKKLKKTVLRQEYVKKIFMTIFVIHCVRQCFLIKSDEILWEKTLEMNVKITDIADTKIN